MSNIPVVPKVAEDANYDAGAYAWSGTSTKIVNPGGFEAKGHIPGQPVPAAYENSFKHTLKECVRDAQLRAVLKVDGQGQLVSSSHPAYLPLTRMVLLPTDVSGTMKASAYSPNLGKYAAGATTVNDFMDNYAYYVSGTTGTLIAWAGTAIGGTGGCYKIQDTKARAVTAFTPPNANARYTDGCMDVQTGNAVMVSAVNPGTPAYGFASGNPNTGLTHVAAGAGTGWTSDNATTIASNPTEVRAFSKAKTFASTDGGATVGAVADTIWGGGLPASSSMGRPTWDAINAQWLVCTADYSTSAAAAASTARLWTSPDGITWTSAGNPTTLAGAPLFYEVLYHRGWIFGIARMLDFSGTPNHDGLEVLASRDGGLTWERTGTVLTLIANAYPIGANFNVPKLTACDEHVLATTQRAVGSAGLDLEYVSILVG